MAEEQLAFLQDYPTGLYRTIFNCTLDKGLNLHTDDRERFRRNLEAISSNPERRYIQTPQQFFERWLNGRRGEEPQLNEYSRLGFELQMPIVKTITYDEGAVFGRIEGLALASDFGYSSNFGSSLVFAINDISTERALVYSDEEERIKTDPLSKKNLRLQRIYGFPDGPQEYPFASVNPLKSLEYTWSLINISPEEVYGALKEIGFVW
ncbi:MAG: hypothetical protein Q7S55_05350 [Nanoarchaeota archaeon]|nr:hypothetical protein [Nanoarchaeota archaeon]